MLAKINVIFTLSKGSDCMSEAVLFTKRSGSIRSVENGWKCSVIGKRLQQLSYAPRSSPRSKCADGFFSKETCGFAHFSHLASAVVE